MTEPWGEPYSGRLLRLADFLDALLPGRFDFGKWVGDDWKGAADLSCGTTACGLGWATAMPEFQALGLHMRKLGSFGFVALDTDPECKDISHTFTMVCRATKMLFGIDYNETEMLFTPNEEAVADPEDEDEDWSEAEAIAEYNAKRDDGADALLPNASARDLARHIRAFVALRTAAP